MNKKLRFTLMSALVVGAYLLSACGGTIPQSTTSDVAQKVHAKEIVFTGIVEAMNGNQWVISGQVVAIDPSIALDPNIAVGDIVKVEGSVSDDGTVVALKIESSTVSDHNSNDVNGNDDNTHDDGNSNDDNSNDDNSNGDNSNGDNSNDAGDDENEVFGVVEAVSADSITVNGVVYQFANFTEIKHAIAVGDEVKIHFIVNADGTLSVREIEKADGLHGGDDNGNSNDDNTNDDNGNDDNSNDGNGDDGNGNDDNSNDDDDDENDNDD